MPESVMMTGWKFDPRKQNLSFESRYKSIMKLGSLSARRSVLLTDLQRLSGAQHTNGWSRAGISFAFQILPKHIKLHPNKYSKPEVQWPQFCRSHFRMYFLDRKHLYFDYNFIEICSQRSICQQNRFGSHTVSCWRQAIFGTNDVIVYWRNYIYIYIYIYVCVCVCVACRFY